MVKPCLFRNSRGKDVDIKSLKCSTECKKLRQKMSKIDVGTKKAFPYVTGAVRIILLTGDLAGNCPSLK